MNKSKSHIWKEILLWILMPIATILGSAFIILALNSLWWIFGKMHSEEMSKGWIYLYLLPITTTFILGFVYAQIPSLIAPRGKVISTIVMVTILAFINLISIILAMISDDYAFGTKLFEIAKSLSLITASIISTAIVYSKYKN
jgi:hypothetical protein